jgi:cytochrome oxidase Cu insertion factor (SCO1/SenC/PrrC family)
MAKHYEINEKDIDEVIRYLKTIDPENATPEMAIAFLEQLQASVHLMSHENPELLDKIYNDLKDKRAAI